MVYHAFFMVAVFHRFQHLEVMVSFCSFHVGLLPQLPEFVLTPVFFEKLMACWIVSLSTLFTKEYLYEILAKLRLCIKACCFFSRFLCCLPINTFLYPISADTNSYAYNYCTCMYSTVAMRIITIVTRNMPYGYLYRVSLKTTS